MVYSKGSTRAAGSLLGVPQHWWSLPALACTDQSCPGFLLPGEGCSTPTSPPQCRNNPSPRGSAKLGVIWCEGEPGCVHQGCCSLARFIGTPGQVLNSKVEVPTAPRKTRSHVAKHLLDTSAASLSTSGGCEPSAPRGLSPDTGSGDAGTGPAAAGGHPPSPSATGTRSSRDWGHRGERGSPAGGSRLGLSLHLVGTRWDVAAARHRGPGRAARSSPRDSDAPGPATPPPLPRVLGAAPCAPTTSQSPVGSYTPSRAAVPEGSRDTGTERGWSFRGRCCIFPEQR